jgi:hypothetical protein
MKSENMKNEPNNTHIHYYIRKRQGPWMDALLDDVEVRAGPAHPRMHIAWMDDRLVFFLFG